MNIVHISPNAPFNDGWGFQENLLCKYHIKLGHTVTLIVPNQVHADGGIQEVECESFVSCDGFRVIRLPYVQYFVKNLSHIFWKLDVYELLMELKPDFIFYHGLVSRTIFDVIKYKKHREKQGKVCRLVQDNHLDYNIGRNPTNFKQKILRSYYRFMNRKTQKQVETVYGVTPWRKQYAEEYYQISSAKTDVLIMGADDEKMDLLNREAIRQAVRHQYAVLEDEFLIVTGGKIDVQKKTHILMQACGDMPKVKLLVFGSVAESLKEEYQRLIEQYDNIVSIGWIDSDKVYDYFFAADLAFFPGQHSVLWEQACASKVPCVFAKWPEMNHVNNGGNSEFVEEITVESLRKTIEGLCFTDRYNQMKKVAMSDATDIYLSSKIAVKSLEKRGESV